MVQFKAAKNVCLDWHGGARRQHQSEEGPAHIHLRRLHLQPSGPLQERLLEHLLRRQRLRRKVHQEVSRPL